MPDFDLNYFKTLINESDRGFVLLTTSRIDEVLKELHKTYIKSKSSPPDKFVNDLFDGHGSLYTLADKIKLAFGYGLISKEDYLDLELLRDLRNGAAHTVKEFAFRQPAIREKIIAFTAPKRVPQQISILNFSEEQRELLAHPNEDENSTKIHFLIAGMCLNYVLMDKILKILRRDGIVGPGGWGHVWCAGVQILDTAFIFCPPQLPCATPTHLAPSSPVVEPAP
jgi:DNA-binding MltR family transcriptional regulator